MMQHKIQRSGIDKKWFIRKTIFKLIHGIYFLFLITIICLDPLLYAGKDISPEIEFGPWSGAITTASATIKAKIYPEGARVRLAVSKSADISNPVLTKEQLVSSDANRMVSFNLVDLLPDIQYYYALEINSKLMIKEQGTFKTFPQGPASFMFAFSSCDRWPMYSTPVFDAMAKLNPLFFLHAGDFHYYDIDKNNRDLYRDAYEATLGFPGYTEFYRKIPMAYMWDDHDFGPNDSDSTSPGREAARLTYQEYVPHYPLPAGSGDVPIYQSFAVGRVKFIMTDLRSERSTKIPKEDPTKTMLGVKQKEWFKQELLNAKGKYPLIVWVSSVPWIDEVLHHLDRWGGFLAERKEIANFIKKNAITGLCILTGDEHMIALDDGTNGDFADGGGVPIPSFMTGALSSNPYGKGGPYSHGKYSSPRQFGIMSVMDSGGKEIKVEWKGIKYTIEDPYKTIVSYTFTVPASFK